MNKNIIVMTNHTRQKEKHYDMLNLLLGKEGIVPGQTLKARLQLKYDCATTATATATTTAIMPGESWFGVGRRRRTTTRTTNPGGNSPGSKIILSKQTLGELRAPC
jgi:hypothetical protein